MENNNIFTSYYAKAARLSSKEYTFCSISRGIPVWFPYDLVHLKHLAPSSQLLARYKKGEITWEQYESIYIKEMDLPHQVPFILERLNLIIKQYNKPIVLLCYEKDTCHRFILGRFIGAKEL